MQRGHQVQRGFLSSSELTALRALSASSDAAWIPGRQGTGYDKLPLDLQALGATFVPLLSRTLALLKDPAPGFFDLYLLRYGPGAHIPPHVDPPLLDAAGHLRLNAIVQQSVRGGVLLLDGERVSLAAGDAVLFRPDLVRHEVTGIEEGDRILFSAGCNVPLERL